MAYNLNGPTKTKNFFGTVLGLFKSYQFWIIIDGLGISLLTVIYYTVSIPNEIVFQQLGVIEILSRYIGIYLTIYFVFKKASKPLPNRK